MKKNFWWITSIVLVLSIIIISWRSAATHTNISKSKNDPAAVKNAPIVSAYGTYVNTIYQSANLMTSGLDYTVFEKAVTGYYNLKQNHKLNDNSSIITIVDFNKPSREKRMWIVDLAKKQLLLNTWVAHGQGSGNDVATQFSNTADSHQSSLGFYVTDGIYFGKHGRSLKLDGMDAGFNSNARARAVVLHAAAYVCQSTINQLGRLGRSFGCPAVSPEVSNQIIDLIKGKNMLFINANSNAYTSKYLNNAFASNFAVPDTNSSQQVLRAAL
ncbi:murein L,D-transpeptidase catalytic domain family protein [Mucilaginibacter sp. Bleaf8]|uniref:murein L,D-transpeptidase catalytic domain family protein n=1 Tax=Mucilaginibacter sp. Bleaf8 TaxID=2834430 RepID=UPI001BCBA9C1|nr:murein L,D-transpeptidase catalytic domain family protein [Mucilaginibacter sp. Bleaf8]MBS7563709.1 murein L,D-transpeptidase catalytic domain family protein [Mucilaginibacter sp. Bleaf8]